MPTLVVNTQELNDASNDVKRLVEEVVNGKNFKEVVKENGNVF